MMINLTNGERGTKVSWWVRADAIVRIEPWTQGSRITIAHSGVNYTNETPGEILSKMYDKPSDHEHTYDDYRTETHSLCDTCGQCGECEL